MTHRDATELDCDQRLRCSEWARQADVNPIGTAGTYRGIVGVEWPLPWPKDASAVEELAGVAALFAPLGIRLQLLRPERGNGDEATVVSFRRDDDHYFHDFERREERVDVCDVVDMAIALARGEFPHEPAGDQVDILVCTHGSRDVCCGSAGTRLAASVALVLDALPGSVRVWSTSHLGGHRFAPTAIVMPHGTCWGFLDPGRLRAIVSRSGSVDDVLVSYRGCLGIGPARAQAMERVAFREIGWSWLDHRRRGRDLGGNRVEIDAVSPEGHQLMWSGLILEGRELPVPVCREPLAAATKTECEFVVSAYTQQG